MMISVVLILVALLMVALAGLSAGAETGMYRLSRLRLRLGVERKRFLFVVLGKSLRDGSGLLMSLLIGTNLAHYAAASIATYIFWCELQDEHIAELAATLVTAPVLFVFAELIPKNTFFYRADNLMPYAAPILFTYHKLFTWCGAVPLLKLASSGFGRLIGVRAPSDATIASVPRHHVRAILQDIREERILSSVQTDIMARLINTAHIGIRSVMTPIGKTAMVDMNSDRSELLNRLKRCGFTRWLVYEGQRTNIVGFVNIYEVLGATERFSDLRGFVKPLHRLGANTPVIDAINTMQAENYKVVLVTRVGRPGHDRPLGIVTMKDLVEELLGELAEW